MTNYFEAMPGMKLEVRQVPQVLGEMWQERPGDEETKYSHATQMNLILHHGLLTDIPHAQSCFEAAVNLSRKIPLRLVVACPNPNDEESEQIAGKLFSQCHIGGIMNSLSCCDALILGYTIGDAPYIIDQISLWLDNDLPTYYWFNAVRTEALQKFYLPFTSKCTKAIYDTKIVGHSYDSIEWPCPTSDLSWHRMLRIRQNIGQFLSGFDEDTLTQDLKVVTVASKPQKRAEGQKLLAWCEDCLKKCDEDITETVQFNHSNHCQEDHGIEITWEYATDKYFRFWYSKEREIGEIQAKFDHNELTYSLQLKPMDLEEVLEAALFY